MHRIVSFNIGPWQMERRNGRAVRTMLPYNVRFVRVAEDSGLIRVWYVEPLIPYDSDAAAQLDVIEDGQTYPIGWEYIGSLLTPAKQTLHVIGLIRRPICQCVRCPLHLTKESAPAQPDVWYEPGDRPYRFPYR